jgi:hypothetical protein
MNTSQEHALNVGLGLIVLANYEIGNLDFFDFEASVHLDKDVSITNSQRDLLESKGWTENTENPEANIWNYEI